MSTVELTSKVKEYKELQQFIKQLQDEADAIKSVITGEMEAREVDTLNLDVFTVKYTPYTTSRLDSAKLKADHQDLYNVYCKTVEAKRFSVQ